MKLATTMGFGKFLTIFDLVRIQIGKLFARPNYMAFQNLAKD